MWVVRVLALFLIAASPLPQPGSTVLLRVERSGKWGFIDRAGQIAIAPQFDEAMPFSEGLAVVQRGNAWGYIDITGQVAIPFRFTLARRFSDGLAHARWRNEAGEDVLGYIDRRGDTAFVCERGNPEVQMTPA
jgi:hypothetical protein